MRGAVRLSAAALGTVFAAGLGLRLYMDRPAENRLWRGEDLAIAGLRGKLPPNAALACPPGYCQAAGAIASPVFAASADRLYRDLEQIAGQEPGAVLIETDRAGRRLGWVVHSAVFRFPDLVTAEIVALGPRRASVALYSRARYGRSDFGVNRRRIESWLSRLERKTTAQ
jgi:uncharacterized protein (DUF1499 family)